MYCTWCIHNKPLLLCKWTGVSIFSMYSSIIFPGLQASIGVTRSYMFSSCPFLSTLDSRHEPHPYKQHNAIESGNVIKINNRTIFNFHTRLPHKQLSLGSYPAVSCRWHRYTRRGYQRRRCRQSGRKNLRRVPVPCGWVCPLWCMSSWPPACRNRGLSAYHDCGHQAVRVGGVDV